MDLQKKIHKIECYHLHLQYKRINKQTQFHKKENNAKLSDELTLQIYSRYYLQFLNVSDFPL